MTSMIIKAAKRQFALLFSIFLLAAFLPGPIFANSGYWAFKKTGVETPSKENLGENCTFKGDGNRSGILGLSYYETKCYSPTWKTTTAYSGNMAWGYHTQFDRPQEEFNAGLDVLIPGKLIGFALTATSTSSTADASAWVSMTTTHPKAGSVTVGGTPVAPANGKALGKGYAKVWDKPFPLPNGRTPQLLLDFGLSGGNAQRGITVRYIYDWIEGGTPPPDERPPDTPPQRGNYLGCYKDDAWNRDLAGYTFNEPGMTTQKCLSACQQKGFGYAATQFSTHCFCANNYGKFGKAGNCDMPCGGNKAEMCGGHSANSVYAIGAIGSNPPPPPPPPGGNVLGCYKDVVGDRDLTGYTLNEPGMTTRKCLSACQQKGFGYAATQFGQHCFCGNSYGKHGKATNCDMPCGGNRAEICGGHSANSVYAAGTAMPNGLPKTKSLTGAWVHSSVGSTQTPNDKVIVIQDGDQVTLVQSYKMEVNRGQWQTLRCIGPLVGIQVRFQCSWAPGGDPMGYAAPWQATFNVSDDWDHLNGTGKEAHFYSRVP